MINFLLLAVAVILFAITLPIALVYIVLDVLSETALKLAIVIDFGGNVLLGRMFNDWLIVKGGYEFGKVGETISSALGKNQRDNTLTKLGTWLADLLDWIDPEHCAKSINDKI